MIHGGRTCPLAEESLLLLAQRLQLGAFDVIVDVSVEPLWIGERALQEDNLRSGAAYCDFEGEEARDGQYFNLDAGLR